VSPFEMHVELTHGAAGLHVPMLVQVCTPLFAHWLVPGEHVPTHASFEQAWCIQTLVPWHADSMPLARHESLPGAQ
jgi:hypothetical protein